MRSASFVLFHSHAPQFHWLKLLAIDFKQRFNGSAVLIVESAKDAREARSVHDWCVYSVEEVLISVDETRDLIISRLSEVESKLGRPLISESYSMDRQFANDRIALDDILRYSERLFTIFDAIRTDYGVPNILFTEPNMYGRRLTKAYFSDVKSLWIYQLTKIGIRLYPEYGLDYSWLSVGEAYRRRRKHGFPDDVRASAQEILISNQLAYIEPIDTQRLARARTASDLLRPQTILQKLSSFKLGDLPEVHVKAFRYLKRIYNHMRYHQLASEFVHAGRYAVYFLHVQPEHTVEGVAFEYRDQFNLCVTIAASLPVDMTLVVKEHPMMLGYRDAEVYKKLKNQPNIKLISQNTRNLDLLRKSSLIFTISGTVALEGLILGVPVITFGRVYYNHFAGVFPYIDTHQCLPIYIRDVLQAFDRNCAAQNASDALCSILTSSYPGRFSSVFTIDEMSEESNILLLRRLLDDVYKSTMPNGAWVN